MIGSDEEAAQFVTVPALRAINCLFSGNTSNGNSTRTVYLTEWPTGIGGTYFNDATFWFHNNTFSRNLTDVDLSSKAAEVKVARGDAKFRNCAFWNDDAAYDAVDGITVQVNDATADFGNCVIEGVTSAFYTPAEITDLGANLATDPTFVDSDGVNDTLGDADDNLRLQAASPAIATGANGFFPLDLYDIDEDGITDECFPVDLDDCVRVVVSACTGDVDIGVYEFDAATDSTGTCDAALFAAGDMDNNGILDVCDVLNSGIDCDGNGLLDACELAEDIFNLLDQDGSGGLDVCQPFLAPGSQGVSFSDHAFSGYIDPRWESDDGVNFEFGISQVALVFSEAMIGSANCAGSVCPDNFIVTVTGSGSAPTVTSVDDSANPKIVLTLSGIIPLKEWTTIEVKNNVVSAATGRPILKAGHNDLLDVGYMPCDVDQDGTCGPFDIIKIRQYITNGVQPSIGTPEDYADINRTSALDPQDVIRFRQLINGVSPPATQTWGNVSMNNPQP